MSYFQFFTLLPSGCLVKLQDGSLLSTTDWFARISAFGFADSIMFGCEITIVFP